MNGSNLLAEADLKPFALCPICLRKIEAYLDIAGGIVEREK
jgi:predicted Zn-dependent protease